MRLLTYTMLIGLVGLILADTDYGRPITPHERQLVYQAIRHMDSKGFGQDAEIALKITNSSHFRYSRFLSNATALFRARGANFGYYAYTPLFSRTRVFVGQSFWEVGDIGQSSIISHELAHIRRHRERFLRGFPRHTDEAQAYQSQYETYHALGLKPYGPDAPRLLGYDDRRTTLPAARSSGVCQTIGHPLGDGATGSGRKAFRRDCDRTPVCRHCGNPSRGRR